MHNILIIGPGKLGGQIAFRALELQRVDKVFLIGRNYSKTQGIAEDLREAFPHSKVTALDNFKLLDPVDLTFFTFSDLKWSPQIGVNDRIIEGSANIKVINQIKAEIDGHLLGTIIIVSNPVDVLTWHTTLAFENINVFGFGISLDEYRMGAAIEKIGGIKCDRLPCLGEHGSHVVPLLSHILDESLLSIDLYNQVRREAFTHTENIVKKVSIPFYGPLRELKRLLNMLLSNGSGPLTMSKYLKEPFLGVKNVALGVPVKVEGGVLNGVEHIRATAFEVELFEDAAKAVAVQKQSIYLGV
jgi:malate/lactate dehydrogenase